MSKQPNILLIMADQHNARCLSAAGEGLLQTPHLDALAGQGIRFTRAYANSAHCGPSRLCFLTGAYEHTHQRHNNNDEPPRHLNPITSLLRTAGYRTALIGKGHLGIQWPREQFDHTRFSTMTDALSDAPLTCDYFRYLVEQGQADNFDLCRTYTRAPDPAITSPMPLEHCVEVWAGNEAVDYVRRSDRSQPWFMMLSFERPHDPLCVSAPYDRMYDPAKVALPASAGDTFETKSPRQQRAARGEFDYPYRPKDADHLKRCLANYYALITLIDQQVGRVLAELEAQGIADDTIVIYTADHGDFAGEHGFMYKNLGFYECVHRIPLIMRYGRSLPEGRLFDGIVESVDLYPTLAEIVGIATPWTVQGRSFLAATTGQVPWTKQASLCEHVKSYHHMSMRTAEFRITIDATGAESELYDHRDDPGELINRWNAPAYRDIRERLLIDMLRYRSCPPLLYGQPPANWRANKEPGFEQPRWCEQIKRIEQGEKWSQISKAE